MPAFRHLVLGRRPLLCCIHHIKPNAGVPWNKLTVCLRFCKITRFLKNGLHVLGSRFQLVSPFNQAYSVFFAKSPLGFVQLTSLCKGLLPSKEIHGMIMLYALVLNGRFYGRHVKVQALSSKPVWPVLIQYVRISLPHLMK